MSDYGALADMLKGSGQASVPSAIGGAIHATNLAAFYERVKVEILEEAKRANVELHKRGLATIDQVFMPCYRGKLCVTFGTALLCTVELNEAKKQIASAILGPPNREEISRREYLLGGGIAQPNNDSSDTLEKHPVEQSPGRIASQIVSELLETGIGLSQKRPPVIEPPTEKTETAWTTSNEPAALAEFWVSLGSLLRSYTAVHGLNDKSLAAIESDGKTISVRHGEKWLRLERNNALVTWTRENGSGGLLEFTGHGQLRGPDGEEAMDLAAEAWARGLMHDRTMESAQ